MRTQDWDYEPNFDSYELSQAGAWDLLWKEEALEEARRQEEEAEEIRRFNEGRY